MSRTLVLAYFETAVKASPVFLALAASCLRVALASVHALGTLDHPAVFSQVAFLANALLLAADAVAVAVVHADLFGTVFSAVAGRTVAGPVFAVAAVSALLHALLHGTVDVFPARVASAFEVGTSAVP